MVLTRTVNHFGTRFTLCFLALNHRLVKVKAGCTSFFSLTRR